MRRACVEIGYHMRVPNDVMRVEKDMAGNANAVNQRQHCKRRRLQIVKARPSPLYPGK